MGSDRQLRLVSRGTERQCRCRRTRFRAGNRDALKRIDLEHLTGVGLIDEPIHQMVELYFGFLAGAVSILLIGAGETDRQLLQYFSYGKGASLAIFALTSMAGLAMFVALSGYTIEGAVVADTISEVAGMRRASTSFSSC